ncbi:MAG: hypothetical protein WA765_06005 [Candidatus Acidiferrum sp.]
MAHDDRDRNFEKALARQLRFSVPSSVEPGVSASAPLESCPDPEILAAYHEQSLSSAELSLWKPHVISCHHCQFVLAQLASTENLALDPTPAQDPLLISEHAPSRKERSRDSRVVNGERHPPSWRWVLLIPAGAIAASLVAWVSLRTPKPLPVPSSPSVEVAENRAAPPVASSSTPAPVVPSDRKEKVQSASPSAGSIGGVISPKRDAAANELRNDLQLNQQSPNQLTALPSHGPSVSLQKQQQQQQASRWFASGAAGTTPRKKLEPLAPTENSENAKSVAVPASPPPPPPPEPFFLDGRTEATPSSSRVSPAPSAPASNGATAKDIPKEKASTTDAIAQSSESVEVSAEPQTRAQARAMLRAAVLQNPRVFVAPDGKHLWRVGPSGSLDYSKDRGLNWTPQTTGVNTDLSAGSAVSAKVAWVVGNSGTILRTTDGGAHWTKLASPVGNDLTGVHATDASHATIWFVPGHLSIKNGQAFTIYQTSDGGITWLLAPVG